MSKNMIPFVGVLLNQDEDVYTLFEVVKDICKEFNYSSTSDFKRTDVHEFLKNGMETFHFDDPELLDCVLDFFDWVIAKSDSLEFVKKGDPCFPTIYLVNKASRLFKYEEKSSYSISFHELNDVAVEVNLFRFHSKQSMSEKLFKLLDSYEVFGLNMVYA